MDLPIELEGEEEQRSAREKELLVDLVREQIRKPSNRDRSEPKIEWPEVQRKFNASWMCTHAASRYELSKMWRGLKNSPRAKMDDDDDHLSTLMTPKRSNEMTPKRSKSSAKKAGKGSSSRARAKKDTKRSPLSPVRQNRQPLFVDIPSSPEYRYPVPAPDIGSLSSPSYRYKSSAIEVPSSPESVKAISPPKKSYFSLRGYEV